ncbi:MAG: Eco57I restriction-modification methylase domain-containing protein [Senegalia sp. (in: firmicutes)]|uniref:Eco57I restriction-modification methylase domain-containing protein n=1 Tax=Senegalia sp. (in: firmicutes) TaxID=1924098 RepID=UPI003F95D39E
MIKSYSIRDNNNILKILLKDRTTRKNIIWATDSYQNLGEGYQAKDYIKEKLFKNGAGELIKPRLEKDDEEQSKRTRGKGEVFTPIWIIKKKIDLIEEEFSKLELEEYINKKWMEITCGEAPYIVNRYNTVTGEYLAINERVGFLDRKLQRISKEIIEENEWFSMVLIAYQASYGYEYQGDSLLIARENLLNSFIDYYIDKFNYHPAFEKVEEIAKVISYNIFQMNGLKYTVPMPEKIITKKQDVQIDFFGNPEPKDQQLEIVIEEGEEVKIKNWLNNRMIKFKDLVKNEGGIGSMKFDVVIGNPPYQEKGATETSRDEPIYHHFMKESYKVGDKVILITPARFLFNAGQTPKKWNKIMLEDTHLKVTYYQSKSNKVFSNTDIKGGVAVTYRDRNKEFGKINIFTPYVKLNAILKKVEDYYKDFEPFSNIVFPRGSYRFSELFFKENSKAKTIQSKGTGNMIVSNSFERLSFAFHENKPEPDSYEYIKMLGRYKNERVQRWLRKDYILEHNNLNYWKVLVAKSNGSGDFGEALSSPIISQPQTGHTDTFISIGSFDREYEANSALKYIKTKLLRALLGVLKVTQDNPKSRWSKIPLQDFTSGSDIDWNKSIAEIDQQLYNKYSLNQEEINFIECIVWEWV